MSGAAPDPYYLDPELFRLALGAALRERREELSLSQQALAELVEASQARIWEWETGVHVIRWDRLLVLCEALATSVTAIMARAETATRDGMRQQVDAPAEPA